MKIEINGKEVFSTDNVVREVSVRTDSGEATAVSDGGDIKIVVTESDNRNLPLDVLERERRKSLREVEGENIIAVELKDNSGNDTNKSTKKQTASSGSKK